jgi:cyclase
MFKPRLIARLDIKNENLIKGIHLEGLRKLGNPNEYAINYYKSGVDELLFMDCVASLYGRNNLTDVIKKAAENIFIPITVGGGIRSVENAEELLHNGADKIRVNTAAVENPKLITELSKRFGSQCVVLSVEAKKISENNWEVFTNCGREKTGLNVIKWIKKAIQLGVGEVLLTSVDFEGTCQGFDYNLTTKVSSVCPVPLIVSGGLGSIDHIKKLLKSCHIDALAAANVLHYKKLKPQIIKKYLKIK